MAFKKRFLVSIFRLVQIIIILLLVITIFFFSSLGAIYENLILFPIQYTLSIDRKQIQFNLSSKMNYSYPQSIIYDMTWSDEQTLLIYQANEITLEKQIQSLYIDNNSLSSTQSINLSQVYPNEEITRITICTFYFFYFLYY